MNRLIKFFKTNYIPLLFSLFLALLLWVAVITDKTYSRKITVPFTISRLAPGYVLAEAPPKEVVLEVSGKGRALFGLSFYASSIDLELPEVDKSTVIDLARYQQRFNIPRNLGIRIVEVLEPTSVDLKVDRLVSTEKPIRIAARIKPMPGYILNKVSADSSSIRVRGPKNIVEKIKSVFTDSLRRDNVRYPFTESVQLLNPAPGIVSLYPSQVNIRFDISQLVERTVYNIPIQLVGVPGNLSAAAQPPNVTIRVKGSEARISALQANEITALYNYRARHENGKTFYDVEVQVPDEVDLLDVSPKKFKLQLKRIEDND